MHTFPVLGEVSVEKVVLVFDERAEEG